MRFSARARLVQELMYPRATEPGGVRNVADRQAPRLGRADGGRAFAFGLGEADHGVVEPLPQLTALGHPMIEVVEAGHGPSIRDGAPRVQLSGRKNIVQSGVG